MTDNEQEYTPTDEEVSRIVDTYVGPLNRGTFARWLAQHDAARRVALVADSRETLVGVIDAELTKFISADNVADALLATGVVQVTTPAETGELDEALMKVSHGELDFAGLVEVVANHVTRPTPVAPPTEDVSHA